jgi:uncharacterized protein (DUF2132 family)
MTDVNDGELQSPEQEAFGNSSENLPENSVPKPSKASRDPLHGVTLERMLLRLVARHGWEEMGEQIPIRCFLFEPSIKSSLKFLRRTPWARKRVEDWYAYDARRISMDVYDD